MHCSRSSRWFRHLAFTLGAALLSFSAPRAQAQFVQSAVGGVMISPQGVVGSLSTQMQRTVAEQIRNNLDAVPPALGAAAEMRKISLAQLDLAVKQSVDSGEPLPDELRFLGGMTRVEYVLIAPEEHDVYLAGPAEAWAVTDQGEVVGQKTGRPIVLLDDLIVALRTVTAAREVGISCSIEPTAEGMRSLNDYLQKQRRRRTGLTPQIMSGAAQAFGPQQILLTGVPVDTHFACVLVAADYQMKRYAMKLEKAPIEALPSYPELLVARRARVAGATPRWWMACHYEPLLRSEDGLTWQLRGQGVRVQTEDHVIQRDGNVRLTGKSNPVAEEWANTMTDNYEQLSLAAPVFGQLRNIMDLSVIAALIEKEQLLAVAGCQLQVLDTAESDPLLFRWTAPTSVDPQISAIANGREQILTASGGVQVASWQVASRSEVAGNLPSAREHQRDRQLSSWWWD